MQLPLIIGFGGINCAGRSSDHQAFKRLVFDSINKQQQQLTIESLAALMRLDEHQNKDEIRQYVLDNSLVRQLTPQWHKQHQDSINRLVKIRQDTIQVTISNRNLPEKLPPTWRVISSENGESKVEISNQPSALLRSEFQIGIQAAASLPTGFDPATHYSSRNHPRSLQMAIFALSDCLENSGINWEQVKQLIPPDAISVYSGSSFGQYDEAGIGGLLKSFALGKRPTAKQIPLGYAQSSADFANAYVLGNLGSTGSTLGACASFLYNLRQGSEDIKSGRAQIAIIGANEAPLVPELMTGFITMNALCSDIALRKLDSIKADEIIDFRRACRPFANNAGFVMAESSQFIILCSPQLAASLGAQIFGSVADIFVNADGFKKSISSTGIGNFVTLAKATASLRSLLGDKGLANSFVHSHGTGTPLNRVSESYILSQIAQAFSIDQWRVAALKGQIGHSQAASAADQLIATIGTWQHGLIPGIETTNSIADDVNQKNLHFLLKATAAQPDAALLNAKGFGGNNATALVLSPTITEKAMHSILGKSQYHQWREKNQQIQEKSQQYNDLANKGIFSVNYKFNHNVLAENDITIKSDQLHIPGYPPINLQQQHTFNSIFKP